MVFGHQLAKKWLQSGEDVAVEEGVTGTEKCLKEKAQSGAYTRVKIPRKVGKEVARATCVRPGSCHMA